MLSEAEHRAVLASGLLERCAFPAGSISLAVSGGADSTAMLALALVARGADGVSVVHVDHGLRDDSAEDARAVAALGARWSVRVDVRHVAVAAGANLEARARAARYAAMPADVCTAHTADDLVESMLLNLLRGAGLDGLVPMRPRADGPCRPLLALRRRETVALCAALGVSVRDDPMNLDPAFRRVRVRHELVPLLDDIAGRDAVALLARQIEVLGADASLLDELSRDLDATDARALQAAPPPLASRAIRRWLAGAGVTPGPVASQAVVRRVLEVAANDALAADLVNGWRVHRLHQRLRLVAPSTDDPVQVRGGEVHGGEVHGPDGGPVP